MNIFRIILVGLFCIPLQNAFAEIYKWVDENGHVQFSDRAPPSKKSVTATKSKPKKPIVKSHNTVSSTLLPQGYRSSQLTYTGSLRLKIRQLLLNKQFDELNRVLLGYQKAVEINIAEEEKLFTAYDAFDIKNTSYEAFLNTWIQSTPGSYPAYLARAKYYFRQAMDSRGGKWASETKEKQFDAMNVYFDKAIADIDTVLNLNKKTIVPYSLLIRIANVRGNTGCRINAQGVKNVAEVDTLLEKYYSRKNFRYKKCDLLIIGFKDKPNKYVIAGLDDKKVLKQKQIDDPNNALWSALNEKVTGIKEVAREVAIMLGIALAVDEEHESMRQGLKINPASYQLRAQYLQAITPRWGGSFRQMKSYIDESLETVSLNPKLALLEGLPYIEAGTIQMRAKKYSVAEGLFTKALDFGESHIALMNRGKNHYRRENYEEALKDLDRAIALYRENGIYYRWRSIVNSRLKKYEAASNDIEQANKLKPNDKNILKQRKWLAQKFTRQGYDSAQLRKSTDAIDNYDAALRLNPDSAELFYRKARAFGDQFKYDLALVEIKKAIELDPAQYSYYAYVDWILAKRKDWNQIIAYWDQYIARESDDSRAYLERGGAYLHKGDIRSAVSNAKIAADMGNPDAKAVYEKYKHRVR